MSRHTDTSVIIHFRCQSGQAYSNLARMGPRDTQHASRYSTSVLVVSHMDNIQKKIFQRSHSLRIQSISRYAMRGAHSSPPAAVALYFLLRRTSVLPTTSVSTGVPWTSKDVTRGSAATCGSGWMTERGKWNERQVGLARRRNLPE